MRRKTKVRINDLVPNTVDSDIGCSRVDARWLWQVTRTVLANIAIPPEIVDPPKPFFESYGARHTDDPYVGEFYCEDRNSEEIIYQLGGIKANGPYRIRCDDKTHVFRARPVWGFEGDARMKGKCEPHDKSIMVDIDAGQLRCRYHQAETAGATSELVPGWTDIASWIELHAMPATPAIADRMFLYQVIPGTKDPFRRSRMIARLYAAGNSESDFQLCLAGSRHDQIGMVISSKRTRHR